MVVLQAWFRIAADFAVSFAPLTAASNTVADKSQRRRTPKKLDLHHNTQAILLCAIQAEPSVQASVSSAWYLRTKPSYASLSR